MKLAQGMKFKFDESYFIDNGEFANQFGLNPKQVYTIHEVKKLPGFDGPDGEEIGATYGATKLMVQEGDDVFILDIESDKTGVWCFIISDYPSEFILEGNENDQEGTETDE